MKSQTQRSLLLAFVGSIACCGVVGIYCLLQGQMGSIQARILATTSVVGAVSLLSLASAIPWERRRWHPIGPLGVLGATLAGVLLIVFIWADDYLWRSEAFMKSLGLACVAGVAFPHVGLLSNERVVVSISIAILWRLRTWL